MTRFARAKGSKASNEKLPHEATSWSEMKQDLQNSLQNTQNKEEREQFNQERQENYNNFLKQAEKPEEKKWADFPAPDLKTIKKKKKNTALKNITEKDVTDDMINEMCYSDPEIDAQLKELTEQVNSKLKKEKKPKDIPQDMEVENESDEAPEETTTKIAPKKIKVKKPKNKKQTLKIESQNPPPSEDKTKKPKTKKQKKQNKVEETPQEKSEKVMNRRRKEVKEETVLINGKQEPIVHYQGFPVTASDKKRIEDLRRSLISKSVPISEVNHTLKLERRKAEKFLARLRKKLCFNCRQSGHFLSECPEVKSSLVDTNGSGICFKCGSGEHSSRDCKVSKDYKFAKCFICREQGHISSQCPDNPRGLYPKGGACRLCGDVTHLQKDCPKKQENTKNEIVLSTISEDNVEGVEIETKKTPKVVKNKVVKF